MSLEVRINALASRLGQEFKTLRASLGDAMPFTRPGNLAVVVGTTRLPIPYACVIESVAARLGTAPSGASAIIDVNRNGTTIYGTQSARPTFAPSVSTATVGAHTVTTLAAGDNLSVDVDAIGTTVPGADLVVVVVLRRP